MKQAGFYGSDRNTGLAGDLFLAQTHKFKQNNNFAHFGGQFVHRFQNQLLSHYGIDDFFLRITGPDRFQRFIVADFRTFLPVCPRFEIIPADVCRKGRDPLSEPAFFLIAAKAAPGFGIAFLFDVFVVRTGKFADDRSDQSSVFRDKFFHLTYHQQTKVINRKSHVFNYRILLDGNDLIFQHGKQRFRSVFSEDGAFLRKCKINARR